MITEFSPQKKQTVSVNILMLAAIFIFVLPAVVSIFESQSHVFALGFPITPPVTSPVTPPNSTTPTPTVTQPVTPPNPSTPTPTHLPTVTPTPTKKPNQPPVISTTALPSATKGKIYIATVMVKDADTKDRVRVHISNLPPGLSAFRCFSNRVGNDGVVRCAIIGIPRKVGMYSVTVKAQDNVGHEVSKTLPLQVK